MTNKNIFSMKILLSLPCFILASVLFWTMTTEQGIGETYINRTRLIFSQKANDESLSIINEGAKPALMQLWIDKEEPEEKPEHIYVPFVVLPPVARLEPQSSLGIRVLFTGKGPSLTADSESLFWLNVLEVPPKMPVLEDNPVLQMAIRTRIKIFYRPNALGDITSSDAVKKLHFSYVKDSNKSLLQIENRSPLYVTLTQIKYGEAHWENNLPHDGMIAPFSHTSLPVIQFTDSRQLSMTVRYIDDYGVISEYHPAELNETVAIVQ